MADTSTKVFVYEAMGRHAGWLAAAAGLAGADAGRGAAPDPVPGAALRRGRLPRRGRRRWWRGSATAWWSRARASATADGRFVADAGGGKDAFGHTQLGGVGSFLAGRVKDELGLKVHWTLPDYLQRSARHLASKTDLEQAQAVGKAAVEYALAGKNATMPVIRRTVGFALPLEDRRGAARRGSPTTRRRCPPASSAQDGYGITAGRAALPRAADPRRGAAALRPRRHPGLRRAEERRRGPSCRPGRADPGPPLIVGGSFVTPDRINAGYCLIKTADFEPATGVVASCRSNFVPATQNR